MHPQCVTLCDIHTPHCRGALAGVVHEALGDQGVMLDPTSFARSEGGVADQALHIGIQEVVHTLEKNQDTVEKESRRKKRAEHKAKAKRLATRNRGEVQLELFLACVGVGSHEEHTQGIWGLPWGGYES